MKIQRKRIKSREKIVLLAISAGLIIAFGVIAFILSRGSKVAVTERLYQNCFGIRYEYENCVLFTNEQGKSVLKSDKTELILDSTPLYNCEKNELILPEDMVLVCPNSTECFVRAERFQRINVSDNKLSYVSPDSRVTMYGGFLFNGSNLYVFLEPMTIVVNYKEYSVQPLSFAEAVDNKELRIYFKDQDKFVIEELDKTTVTAISNQGYQVQLTSDKLEFTNGRKLLLFTEPSVLPVFRNPAEV